MGAFLYLLFAVIAIAFLWVKQRYNYWRDKGFVQADVSFPFGSLKGVNVSTTLAEKLNTCYNQFKGKAAAVGNYIFLSPMLLAIDPELIKNIFVREFSSFHDRGFYYNKKDDPVSANILALDGEEWRNRRVKLTPIFTSGKMKLMFDIIDNIGNKLVTTVEEDLKSSSELDMRNFCQYYTNDNIGNVAFGHEYQTLENRDSIFLRHGQRLFSPTVLENFKLLFTFVAPGMSRILKFRFTPKEAGDFFHKSFLDTIEQREKSQIKRNDFVQLLLGLKNLYTPSELAAEAFLVYTGGYETSSTLMQFALYELALNQDIQDRLRNEINQEIEDNDDKLTYDLLSGMKYLDMVVNESLRKYPPIPNSFRRSTKEYKIPDTNLVIPKGTFTIINTFSLHRDAEYYPEPEKFDPERFSDENIKNIVPYTYLPFGEGPRNCLGMRFGLMQAKLGIVKLIKNFKLSICDKSPVPLNFVPAAPFLTPVGGMILKVERIS